jgi:hypothetical protein
MDGIWERDMVDEIKCGLLLFFALMIVLQQSQSALVFPFFLIINRLPFI